MDSIISVSNENEAIFTSEKMTLFIIFSLRDISKRFNVYIFIPTEIIYRIVNELRSPITCSSCNYFLSNYHHHVANVHYKTAFHEDFNLGIYSYICFNCNNRFCEGCSDVGAHVSKFCENCFNVGKKNCPYGKDEEKDPAWPLRYSKEYCLKCKKNLIANYYEKKKNL